MTGDLLAFRQLHTDSLHGYLCLAVVIIITNGLHSICQSVAVTVQNVDWGGGVYGLAQINVVCNTCTSPT